MASNDSPNAKIECIADNCHNYAIDNNVDYCRVCLRTKIFSIMNKMMEEQMTGNPSLSRGFMNSFNEFNRLFHDGLTYGVITMDDIN